MELWINDGLHQASTGIRSFLLVGQSNMAGRGDLTPENAITAPDCFMLRMGRWQPMSEPINVDRPVAEGACPRSGANLAASFAARLQQQIGAPVGLIPCADGGTRISQWQPGEVLFDHAVFQAKLAVRTSALTAILWHQGESDCLAPEQQELQKGDDIANNLNATLRLIDKCQKISKSCNDNDSSSTQLVPVGTVQDVGFLLEAEADEMYQLQAICNGAELFPETDASKALLKRSQIIDMTLLFNKKQPVMFTLSEEEQLLAGNQFMRLLIKRAGSLKEAIPYAIGRKKLEEIGIHNEFEKELKIMRYDAPLKLLYTNNDA